MAGDERPVGFIGLGQIGAPMATRLLGWPGGLVVCDARPEALEPFVAEGATAAATPAEVAAAGATVISVMVRDDDQVRDVVDGESGILRTAAPGTVIAVHSTIRVGGDDDAVARCQAPFERFAGLVLHFGPVGAGTRAKIARNLISFASFAVVAESQRLAEAAGISLTRLARVVRHSDAITGGPGAIMLRRDTEPLADDDPLRPIMEHTRSLGEKDLALALALADELDVDVPLTAEAARSLAAGLGVPHPEP